SRLVRGLARVSELFHLAEDGERPAPAGGGQLEGEPERGAHRARARVVAVVEDEEPRVRRPRGQAPLGPRGARERVDGARPVAPDGFDGEERDGDLADGRRAEQRELHLEAVAPELALDLRASLTDRGAGDP